MNIKKEDRNFVSENFSDLKFVNIENELFLRGILNFVVRFDRKNKEYFILKEKIDDNFYTIKDSFDIEINLSKDNVYREVREVSKRIFNTAKIKKRHPSDLHLNNDSYVCVTGYLDEDFNISLIDFLGKVIIPFFYDQSFFGKNDYWPRGEFSHGVLGILENFYEKNFYRYSKNKKIEYTKKCVELIKFVLFTNNQAHINKEISEYRWNFIKAFIFRKKNKKKIECIECSRKFCECHPKAFKGLKKLRINILNYNLKKTLNL